jgi:hypothetical protein
MSLFEKFLPIQQVRNDLLASGINPFHLTIEKIISPTEAVINGRTTILVGTNNYLGLTFHPDCIQAGQEALAQEGTGTTGSRMANGSFSSHGDLEQAIADFYGMPYAIVFSTGYQANLGVLSALAGPGDTILMDGDGTAVLAFEHGQPDVICFHITIFEGKAERHIFLFNGSQYFSHTSRAHLGGHGIFHLPKTHHTHMRENLVGRPGTNDIVRPTHGSG